MRMNNIERPQPGRTGLSFTEPRFGLMDLGEPCAAQQISATCRTQAKRRFYFARSKSMPATQISGRRARLISSPDLSRCSDGRRRLFPAFIPFSPLVALESPDRRYRRRWAASAASIRLSQNQCAKPVLEFGRGQFVARLRPTRRHGLRCILLGNLSQPSRSFKSRHAGAKKGTFISGRK